MSTLVANDAKGAGPRLRVGDWSVDPARNELSRGSELVKLEPKVIEVLVHLARRAGEVVGREEMLSAVWPGVVVGDDALTQAIIKLRKALGDDAHRPKYIETISKRGYRLIAPVEEGGKAVAASRKSSLRRDRLVVAAAAVVLLVSVGALLVFPELARMVGMPWPIAVDEGLPLRTRPTIAVLPLTNLSGDAKRDYFSDGVTEDIIDALGRFSGVRVMSRNAVQGFKGKSPSPQAIRTELGAGYIVQGSVREADSKVRVAVELSDTKGVQLWSERYDVEGTQLFEIQDRIAKNIVGRLHVKLTRLEQQRAFTQPTDNLEAYDLVLRARTLLERDDRGANREARALLARAQKLSPDYADIFTALAQAETQRAQFGWIEDPADGLRRAEELAKKALASPDQRAHARAHALIAFVYGYQDRFEEALRHAERAIELNPSDAMAIYRRGSALLWVGRLDEAIADLETAKRYEPPAGTRTNLAIAYSVTGRYREALAEADILLARAPQLSTLHALRAGALAQLGNLDEARLEADQVRRLSPGFRAENYATHFEDPKYTARVQDGMRKAGL